MRISFVALVAVATLFLIAQAQSCTAAITSIVAFGDSLTDVGRLGRFTDGILWIEELADRLHVPIPRASNRGGTNYATGGAATANITTVPDMDEQVANYLFSHAPGENVLYALWGGHNDLFGGVAPARVAGNLGAIVSRLYASGARQFLVPTLAPLDLTPRERGGPNEAALATAVALTNSLLLDEMRRLESTLPNSVLYLPDTHALFLDMFADFASSGAAGVFGYQNVTDAALLTGGSATTHMWLDPIHPTSKTHQYIGAFVASTIPEPTSLFLLVIGGVTLSRTRFMVSNARMTSPRLVRFPAHSA